MQPAQAATWVEFLRLYSEKNKERKTRLGVFEGSDDYWIESDLPLTAIDIDPRSDGPGVTIILGNYTHAVRNARSLAFRFSFEGDEDGVDILDGEGKATILRFEK